MPFYRFTIHGSGRFRDERIAGFYTTKWCWAANKERAAARALHLVRDDWQRGQSARLMGRTSLTLEVERAWRIRLFEIWNAPNRGHTFYDREQDRS